MKHKEVHELLLGLTRPLPSDYGPWGQQERDWDTPDGNRDCSWGCRWFLALPLPLGMDWGVCTSGRSPRAGLLTFEHQGGKTCFEPDDDGKDSINNIE